VLLILSLILLYINNRAPVGDIKIPIIILIIYISNVLNNFGQINKNATEK